MYRGSGGDSISGAIFLSLGLFVLVISTAVFMLTAKWTDRLDVDKFWSAISGLIIFSVSTTFINRIYKFLR
jgi:uncharacterized membrane protein YvlD (DUF360 family)